MTAGAFLDVVGFTAVSNGTGDFVVSAAVTGYQTPASAGAVNAVVYSYRAQSADLTQWEDGFGAYTVAGTTLARTTVVASSTGAKVSFTNPPNVFVTALTADLANASLLTGGLVSVAVGGTGVANPAAHTIPINEGSSAQSNTGTGTAGQTLISGGASADPAWKTPAVTQATPTPGSTFSTTELMQGTGSVCTITPVYSTRLIVTYFGDANSSVATTIQTFKLRFGTGTAPVNGSTLSGTVLGTVVINATTVGGNYPFSFSHVIASLTPGTAYWFDISTLSNAGTDTLSNLNFTAVEI